MLAGYGHGGQLVGGERGIRLIAAGKRARQRCGGGVGDGDDGEAGADERYGQQQHAAEGDDSVKQSGHVKGASQVSGEGENARGPRVLGLGGRGLCESVVF